MSLCFVGVFVSGKAQHKKLKLSTKPLNLREKYSKDK
ncbi:hypothetical protein DERP_001982 [Dermatophagoides pteronyssinus]|uniref:Uncharacterized protein n=1 Tax=Dermatophagoides pteronyssinus TaxID=6956 RepID=A0ABQ8JCS4_DERPT|nr:hypothetical protein DERP_001982 [Dermatophagoides pteronyssinus]